MTLERYALNVERQKNKRQKLVLLGVFLLPYAIAFIMFFVYPLINGIYISFFKFDGQSLFPTKFVGFDNYVTLFTNRVMLKHFWGSFGNTILFSLVVVPLTILIPLGLALLINIKPPLYKTFRSALYIPTIFPLTATGLILLRMFDRQSGFINAFFALDVDWFGQVNLAWLMVLIFCVWGGIGGNLIIFSAGLQNVDKTLYEAAKVDGCSPLRRFFQVTLPGIKPQLILCIFTTMVGYMNLYGQNLILTSNTPDQNAVKTAVFIIQEQLLGSSKLFGLAAAMGIMLGIYVMIITSIQLILSRDKKGGHRYENAYVAYEQSRQDR
ncbi:MAG: sugar ABC transporter permease [Bacilli bacterium]|jgi:multiple sugar transport system permease protein